MKKREEGGFHYDRNRFRPRRVRPERSTSRPYRPPLRGITCQDFGCETPDRCDYPVFGKAAAQAVASGQCEKGIVICTTGIGISISANKVKGIRCALWGIPFAEMCRRHNNANMLAMGAGIVGPNLAERMVDVFLSTEFDGGRHTKRVELMMEIEG